MALKAFLAQIGLPGVQRMPETPRSDARPRFDGSMIFFVLLAVFCASLVYWIKGSGALAHALGQALRLCANVVPLIALGLMLGGLARELADPRRIAPILGAQSGWAGLVLATGLGAVTPGGPFAAFPIVYALFIAGADAGAVIAYVTAWSVIGIHRVVIWEWPLLGHEFVIVRVLTSLPLPILAGALARVLARGPLMIERPEAIVARVKDRV